MASEGSDHVYYIVIGVKRNGYSKVKCPYCGSEEQRYLCQNKECAHKAFQVEYKNNASRPGMKEKIIRMVMNRAGTRDTRRALGVSKDTVTVALKNREIYQAGERGLLNQSGGRKTSRCRYLPDIVHRNG